MTRECGSSARTFKNALIWLVADSAQAIKEEARKLLAWQAIDDESADLKFDETQKRQLAENIHKTKRDLKEAVWRSYKHVLLLSKDNTLRQVDLGLVHSSAADSPISNVLNRLTSDGDIDKGISVRLLLKNWSSAFTEWSTKGIRDAIYASPQFPRIIRGTEAIKDAIAKGVSAGELAYVSKTSDGRYLPFLYGVGILPSEVEISDDVFIIKKEIADAYKESATSGRIVTTPDGKTQSSDHDDSSAAQPENASLGTSDTSGINTLGTYSRLEWTGEVSPQKWVNFYTKVVSKFASTHGVRLTVKFEAFPEGGISKQKVDEVKSALRELGLDPDKGQTED